MLLKNVSMTIRKGEKLALVGENGAGKTTLIKLIMRLYDVTEGEILFGGVDIRKLNTKAYREKIGAVFQDFQIYGATLAENVKTDFVDENDSGKYFSVKDTGVGIPPEAQERVFERFYRVDKSHSRKIGGTGLGLSIVKHGTAFHNAEIQMNSTENVGTEITIVFK